MLYVSVRWSRLHGLNRKRSMGVMGRTFAILFFVLGRPSDPPIGRQFLDSFVFFPSPAWVLNFGFTLTLDQNKSSQVRAKVVKTSAYQVSSRSNRKERSTVASKLSSYYQMEVETKHARQLAGSNPAVPETSNSLSVPSPPHSLH